MAEEKKGLEDLKDLAPPAEAGEHTPRPEPPPPSR